MTPIETTKGQARLIDGRVVITFGLLDRGTRSVHDVTVDVDAYAIELVRDLASALSEQGDSEGVT